MTDGSTTTTTPSWPFAPAPPRPGPLRPLAMFEGAGTAASITSSSIVVKESSGSDITFTTNSSTVYETAGVKVGRSAVAVGDHVLVGTTRPGPASANRTAASVYVVLPEILGKVVSVSGSSLVVQDSEGFWRHVDLSSSTVYQRGGEPAAATALKTGTYVLVSGHIAADHQTLEAVAIRVLQIPSSNNGKPPLPAFGTLPPAFFGLGLPGFPGPALGRFRPPLLPPAALFSRSVTAPTSPA